MKQETTVDVLERSIRKLAKQTGRLYYLTLPTPDTSMDGALFLERHTPGKYSVCETVGSGWRNVSPTLPAKTLELWLDGALTALDIRPRE